MMGLDITSYGRATLVPAHVLENEWCEEHVTAFAYDGFEQSFRGLEMRRCYDTIGGENYRFHAGAYSGYNNFRSTLASDLLEVNIRDIWEDPDAYRDTPFFELLNFADNEGCIGPEAAADLLEDFKAHRDRWVALHDEGSMYVRKYDDWTHAFELAAGTGLVEFH